MPQGKAAGVRCVQLDDQARCRLFGRPERPAVCVSLQPALAMCGPDAAHALHWLARLEAQTAPGAAPGPRDDAREPVQAQARPLT
jgi:hypothetical protein